MCGVTRSEYDVSQHIGVTGRLILILHQIEFYFPSYHNVRTQLIGSNRSG